MPAVHPRISPLQGEAERSLVIGEIHLVNKFAVRAHVPGAAYVFGILDTEVGAGEGEDDVCKVHVHPWLASARVAFAFIISVIELL